MRGAYVCARVRVCAVCLCSVCLLYCKAGRGGGGGVNSCMGCVRAHLCVRACVPACLRACAPFVHEWCARARVCKYVRYVCVRGGG